MVGDMGFVFSLAACILLAKLLFILFPKTHGVLEHRHTNKTGYHRLPAEISMPLGETHYNDQVFHVTGRIIGSRPVGISVYSAASIHRFFHQDEDAACAIIETSEADFLE